jgi:hypothetical protein
VKRVAQQAIMDPNQIKIPPMKDLTIDNITENTITINSQNPDARLKFLLERLVTHLHDFARETRLSAKEWMAGLEFLTATGQTCTDVRQVGFNCRDGYRELNADRNLFFFQIF